MMEVVTVPFCMASSSQWEVHLSACSKINGRGTLYFIIMTFRERERETACEHNLGNSEFRTQQKGSKV